MYKLAIFDFDGTLVDSAPGIIEIMKKVGIEYNLNNNIIDHWSTLIGVPLDQQARLILPGEHPAMHAQLVDRYRVLYNLQNIELCPPFPGLLGMLKTLRERGIITTIASSKRKEIIQPILDHHDLNHYFDMVLGAGEVSQHKPSPEAVHHTLQKHRMQNHEAVVIGDSIFDLEMARNAGVDSIGVTTGVHKEHELREANPVSVVGSLDDVLKIVLTGRKQPIVSDVREAREAS
ncbi:HAD family hydrolase [bacterium]|nr:HAD family hydrolase [bacterium]